MPWSHPTLSDLLTQAANDVTQSPLPGADGFAEFSVLRVVSASHAGFAFGMYGYLDWIAQQSVPFTATDEFLQAWAALKGIYKLDATPASGTVAFVGTPGAALAAGAGIKRSDGFAFSAPAGGTVASNGTISVDVVALTPGSAGNAAQGTQFALANSAYNINASGTAATAITGGTDQEIDDSLRARMLDAYANPASGGSQTDYVNWALAVPGVTRAWCHPSGYGPGTVVVYSMFDSSEASAGGFPQGSNGCATSEARGLTATGDQLAVANSIYPQAPVTALVFSAAPLAFPINFTFSILSPNNATIQGLITAALTAFFVNVGTPLGQLIAQSEWETAISAVPGLVSFAVSVPATSVTVPLGSLPTLGTIAF